MPFPFPHWHPHWIVLSCLQQGSVWQGQLHVRLRNKVFLSMLVLKCINLEIVTGLGRAIAYKSKDDTCAFNSIIKFMSSCLFFFNDPLGMHVVIRAWDRYQASVTWSHSFMVYDSWELLVFIWPLKLCPIVFSRNRNMARMTKPN